MSEEVKAMNRWLVVVGAILIQCCLGALYAWSVFTNKLGDADGLYGFSTTQTQWIFSAALATFAIVMLFAGRWMAKIGPRRVALMGGMLLGVGYVLASFLGDTSLALTSQSLSSASEHTAIISPFALQFICIGIIGGAGIGLTYVVPIAVGVKWFPDMKGKITGLSVAGFGFGAVIWIKLAGSWFGGGLLNTTNLFGLPGVQSVYFIYGLAFVALICLGCTVMVNPPRGWRPLGWHPSSIKAGSPHAQGAVDLKTRQMVATKQYWGLILMFVGSAMAGLMVIGCIRLYGIDSLMASGAAENADKAAQFAGTAMACYAILNGLGRIIWGAASDKLGRKLALFLMCLLQGIMMLVFFHVGGTKLGLVVGACIIGFNFGGNFALFPAATADFFGNKNVGSNYPWIFLAYGVAGIVGPQLAAYFKDNAAGTGVDAWKTPFMIAGIACLAAASIGLILKPPRHLEEPALG